MLKAANIVLRLDEECIAARPDQASSRTRLDLTFKHLHPSLEGQSERVEDGRFAEHGEEKTKVCDEVCS